MIEKLPYQLVAVRSGLGKQQNPGGKAIDTMDNEGSLPLQLQAGPKQRQCRRNLRSFDRHGQ
jgi:hypothetical protein